MSSTIERSNGFLPRAPLSHADPTAVGFWDMERDPAVRFPLELPNDGARDQIVLVRLHRQPMAILHLREPPRALTRDALLAAAWEQARSQIVEHIASCQCLAVPGSAAELAEALADGDRAELCAHLDPPRPDGAAAVILCTVGRENVLERSLRALAEMDCEGFSIIVVDNRPSVPTTRALVESFRATVPVHYVAEPRPGLARARNAGVAAARDATYVAFTDDDVIVDSQWLAWLLAPFSDSRVQAVTGLVMPYMLRSRTEKRFEQYAGFGKGVRREVYDRGENGASDRFLYPYWGGVFGSGNSMVFRREALAGVGGFDPALGPGTPTGGGEEIAAFSDVILAGGKIVYEPCSLCWHEHRDDEAALRAQVRNYGIGLTAVLWRYMKADWRFSATLVRSLPSIAQLIRRRAEDQAQDHLPADLARLEQRGRLIGPWRYTISRRKAAKARGSRRPPGEAGGGARDQACAQTRT